MSHTATLHIVHKETTMQQTISLILDILVVAMLLFPILSGVRRGIKGTLLMLIATALSAGTGFVGSKLLAPSAYDRYFSESVHQFCLENAAEYDPINLSQNILSVYGADVTDEDIRLVIGGADDAFSYAKELAELNDIDDEQIQQLIDQLSSELLRTAPEAMQGTIPEALAELFSADLSDSDAFGAAQAAASSPEEIAAYTEENYVKPIAVALVRAVLFSVISIFARLIIYAVYAVCGLDVNGTHAKKSERTAGAALGFALGAAQLVILMLFVNAVEKTSAGLFSPEQFDSAIFLPIYRFFFG